MKIKSVSINEVEYTAHRLAIKFMTWDEPIPSFSSRFPNILESCLKVPFQTFQSMKSIVISGSASLQPQMKKWVLFWKKRGYKVLDWPQPIPKKEFFEKWPKVHKKFYKALEILEITDIHFVANENKNGQRGYVGNGAFAEISFSAGLNLIRKKKIEIILQQKLSSKNQFFRDIEIWERMGWLHYFNPARDP